MIVKEGGEVFMDLYQPVHEQFMRYCKYISSSEEEGKDLAGESILRALENFEKLKKRASFLHFLLGIARRVNANNYRRKKIRSVLSLDFAANISSDGSSPDIYPDLKFLEKALQKLPLKQKEAIILFEISGFSLKEIQALQGGSLSGVKLRLKRGREKLKTLMVEKEATPKKLITENGLNYERG